MFVEILCLCVCAFFFVLSPPKVEHARQEGRTRRTQLAQMSSVIDNELINARTTVKESSLKKLVAAFVAFSSAVQKDNVDGDARDAALDALFAALDGQRLTAHGTALHTDTLRRERVAYGDECAALLTEVCKRFSVDLALLYATSSTS